MLAALTLAPVAILSSVLGVHLVRRVPPDRFYALVYALLIATGCKKDGIGGYSTMARSSIGQDASLSRWQGGFDSRTGQWR